jgi:hypothetical protein
MDWCVSCAYLRGGQGKQTNKQTKGRAAHRARSHRAQRLLQVGAHSRTRARPARSAEAYRQCEKRTRAHTRGSAPNSAKSLHTAMSACTRASREMHAHAHGASPAITHHLGSLAPHCTVPLRKRTAALRSASASAAVGAGRRSGRPQHSDQTSAAATAALRLGRRRSSAHRAGSQRPGRAGGAGGWKGWRRKRGTRVLTAAR